VVKGCDFKGESGGYGKVESSLEAPCGHQLASAAVAQLKECMQSYLIMKV
jgi:hypothetical protein